MGTSQRYNPSVKGKPNWGKSSSSVSRLGNALIDDDKLEQQKDNLTQKQYMKRKKDISLRIENNYRNAISHYIKAAGGANAVSSGTSRVLGHSGISIIQNFVSTIKDISEQGLSHWLSSHNYGSLSDKTKDQVLEIITIYVQDQLIALDDTAANEALEYLMDKIDERLSDDSTINDVAFEPILVNGEMKELIDSFFAIYIYSHISQALFEKLEKNKDTEYANGTMKEIKDLILEDVKGLPSDESATTIDWGSEEGLQFIKEELGRIIHIYLDDETNN